MKKIILLSAIIALAFIACTPDEEPIVIEQPAQVEVIDSAAKNDPMHISADSIIKVVGEGQQ